MGHILQRFFGIYIILYEWYIHRRALRSHLGGPDAGLNFADVSLLQIEHTQAGLSDAAAHTQWQGAVEQSAVEVESRTILLT